MSALLTRLVPRRKSPPTAQQSKLSSRFGDVQITAPTPGGWSHYESARSIESYNTIPSLDRLLSKRPWDARPQSRRSGPRSPPTFVRAESAASASTSASTSASASAGARGLPESPKEKIIGGQISPQEIKPARERAQTLDEQRQAAGVGTLTTVTVNPPVRPAEKSRSGGSPRSMNNTRFTHKRGHSRSPELSRRGTLYQMDSYTKRSASAGPMGRRPYYDRELSDTETIFSDSSSSSSSSSPDDDDHDEGKNPKSSCHSKRDSGFILDEIDVNVNVNTKALSSPEVEGWALSQGSYDHTKRMKAAVEDAERRRREAEEETENVKRLLAAVQEKKGRKGKGKVPVWTAPVKELVPDAADIWG